MSDPSVIVMDATAATGMHERRGLGASKDMDMRWLWFQSAVQRGDIKLKKIDATLNPAYLMTMLLSADVVDKRLKRMGCRVPAVQEWF